MKISYNNSKKQFEWTGPKNVQFTVEVLPSTVGGSPLAPAVRTVEHKLAFDPANCSINPPPVGDGEIILVDEFGKKKKAKFTIKFDGTIVMEPSKPWWQNRWLWAIVAVFLLPLLIWSLYPSKSDNAKTPTSPATLAVDKTKVSPDTTSSEGAALKQVEFLRKDFDTANANRDKETKAMRDLSMALVKQNQELQQQLETLKSSSAGATNTPEPPPANVIITSGKSTNSTPFFGHKPEEISVTVTGHHNNVVIGDNINRVGYQDSTNSQPTVIVTNVTVIVTNQVISPITGQPLGVFNNTINNNNSSQSSVASASGDGDWNWFKGGGVGQVGKIKTSNGEEYDMRDLDYSSTPLLGQRWFKIPGFPGWFAKKSEGSTGFTYSKGEQL